MCPLQPDDRVQDSHSIQPEDLLAIDQLCDQFEVECRAGHRDLEIEAFVNRVRAELRPTAREEILAVAQHWQNQQAQQTTLEQAGATTHAGPASVGSESNYIRLRHLFRLEHQLGTGATGEVWKAIHRQTGEVVAIKIPHPALLLSLTALIRFCREARWQARLRHPGIGAPEEVIMAGELPVLVSRYIDGMTLKDFLRQGPLPLEQAVSLLIQLADGLEYAHAMGIVHRDLKPANVILERAPDGSIDPTRPVIVDFGLANAADHFTWTHEDQALGTPAYMSPEQARGGSHAAGIPSDIYSLGVILFECLTGRLPIEGLDTPTLLHNVIYDSPLLLRKAQRYLPIDIEQICAACLRKAARDRYQSARDLAEDLRRWRRHETIRMRRPSFVSRLTQWGKRHPAIMTTTFSVLVAIATTSIMIARESYIEQLQHAYNQSTSAIYSARIAQQELESHLAAHRMARIGSYWRLNNPEQARMLLKESPPAKRTWEWRYHDRQINRYHRELHHSSSNDERRYTVRSLAITSDGNTLYSGSRSGTVYRWNVSSTSNIPELVDSLPGGILAVACSSDDQLIAYGSNEGAFVLREKSGDESVLHQFELPDLAVHAIAFSPDGRHVAIGGGKKVSESLAAEIGFLIVLDLETGTQVYRDLELDRCLVSLEWHSDNNRLLGAGAVASRHPDSLRSHGAIWLWEQKNWGLRTFPQPRIVRGVDWSPADPDCFAVSMGDGSHTLWSAVTGKEVRRFPPMATSGMACQFNPDGRLLATASEDGICSLWNIDNGLLLVSYNAHTEGISSLVFSANQQLITGGLDEFIRFWEAKPDQDPSFHVQSLGKLTSTAQYGDHVLIAVNDVKTKTGRIYALRFTQQSSDLRPQLLFELPVPIVRIACSIEGDATLAAILNDNTLVHLKLRDELFSESYSEASFTNSSQSFSLPFTIQDDFIVSRLRLLRVPGRTFINVVDFATGVSEDTHNQNRVWSMVDGSTQFESFLEQSPGVGRCFAVSKDGHQLATSSDQNHFTVWSGNPFKIEKLFYGHQRVVSALAFSPDGKQIASGSWDRMAVLWRLQDGLAKQTLSGHTGNVLALAFHPSEPRLFTAGIDRQIRVWDTDTGVETTTLSGHKSPIIHLYFDTAGKTLMSIDDEGEIRCW